MKKWWIVLLIVLGAVQILALIVAVAVFAFLRASHYFEPMDGPGMVYEVVVDAIDYQRTDHVTGETYRITATRGDGVHIVMERRPGADAEPVVREVDADEELLRRIGDTIRDGGLEGAANLPERDPYVMPDVTAKMTVTEPYREFTVTSLMELSADQQNAWNAVIALLESAIGERMYRVDYGMQKDFYQNAQDAYPAGALVVLYYDVIATDTDYTFLLDGESIRYSYDNAHGFVIQFTMPAHDVTLACETRNSMTYMGD